MARDHGGVRSEQPSRNEVSMYAVHAFVRLRGLAANHQELAERLDQLTDKTEPAACSTTPCR
jgi:hypothetical protein